MELLLNLIWILLAMAAFIGFLTRRRVSGQLAGVPYCKSLLALACGAVLLFPVVSASDDLHPAQAVMEDASKKVQLAIAPLHLRTISPPMLPGMFALCLMCALVILQPLRPLALKAHALDSVAVPSAGRAPPTRWN